mmetsp:Transcript_14076/g.33365  ORF Transcript_14076/g.33365 Transcript_14076/m.33365 type:complete len:379 (-) Transcript_14076:73-1209(-)
MFSRIFAHVSGNEIAQKYEVSGTHSASGGHRFLWKVYNAVHRKTRLEVSIFILDKEDPSIKAMSKTQKEALFEAFRREVAVLKQFASAKPQPHPGLLRFFEGFEETKKCLAFVSERVVFSLHNALGHFENLDDKEAQLGLQNSYAAELMAEPHMSGLEATRGIAQVVEALEFGLRGGGSASGKRRLHLDLGPHAVYLTPDGQWRLGGWGFSVELGAEEQATLCPYYLPGDTNSDGSQGVPVAPWLVYAGPELTSGAAGGDIAGLTPQADMYSLGLIIAEVFRAPKHPSAGATRGASEPLLAPLAAWTAGSGASERLAPLHARGVAQVLSSAAQADLADGLRRGVGGGHPALGQTLLQLLSPTANHRPAANTVGDLDAL